MNDKFSHFEYTVPMVKDALQMLNNMIDSCDQDVSDFHTLFNSINPFLRGKELKNKPTAQSSPAQDKIDVMNFVLENKKSA